MPELRWTLLILGALFVVALAWWEVRRQRQSPRHGVNKGMHSGQAGSGPALGVGTSPTIGPDAGLGRVTPAFDSNGDLVRGHREPTISFPELQPENSFEPMTASRDREPTPVPPIIEVDDAAFRRLDAGADRMEHEIAAMEAAQDDVAASETAATRAAHDELDEHAADSPSEIEDGEIEDGEIDEDEIDHGMRSGLYRSPADAEALADTLETTAARETPEFSESVEGTAELERPAGLRHFDAPAVGVAQHPTGASAAGEPVVNWPGETSRKILALRLVSAPASRFQGRAVRQALAAEGFILGKFDIFHKPGPDERAVLSAASLTKPGTFAMNTMDAQRFGGLSLFAVLPGPLPAQAAFDELVTVARSLNDRLQGALQDERGEPLTPVRSATIRQSLGDPDDFLGDASDYLADDRDGAGRPGTRQ